VSDVLKPLVVADTERHVIICEPAELVDEDHGLPWAWAIPSSYIRLGLISSSTAIA
jgi:hypothetical protein